jgi:hypothetical protein
MPPAFRTAWQASQSTHEASLGAFPLTLKQAPKERTPPTRGALTGLRIFICELMITRTHVSPQLARTPLCRCSLGRMLGKYLVRQFVSLLPPAFSRAASVCIRCALALSQSLRAITWRPALMSDVRSATIRILPAGVVLRFSGRDAWALHALILAGERGCTPIDYPGPRWSGYVHRLRRAGLVIETCDERHAGPYPGRDARYILRSVVEIVSIDDTEEAA